MALPKLDPAFIPQPAPVVASEAAKIPELIEEPAYTPLPRDYASDFGSSSRLTMEAEEHAQTLSALYPEQEEDAGRDLDVPAFMRRLQF